MFLKSNAHKRNFIKASKLKISINEQGLRKVQQSNDEDNSIETDSTHEEDVELYETLLEMNRRVQAVFDEFDHDAINQVSYRQQRKMTHQSEEGQFEPLTASGVFFHMKLLRPTGNVCSHGKTIFIPQQTTHGASTKAFQISMINSLLTIADVVSCASIATAAKILFSAFYRLPGTSFSAAIENFGETVNEFFKRASTYYFDNDGEQTEMGKNEGYGRFDFSLASLLAYLYEQENFRGFSFSTRYEVHPHNDLINFAINAAIEVGKINETFEEQEIGELLEAFKVARSAGEDTKQASENVKQHPVIKTLIRLFEPCSLMDRRDSIHDLLKQFNINQSDSINENEE